jgi:hypothetical protein
MRQIDLCLESAKDWTLVAGGCLRRDLTIRPLLFQMLRGDVDLGFMLKLKVLILLLLTITIEL